MSKSSSKKLNISGSVWLLVLLLALLVIASASLLGSFIKRYAAGEKNVIGVMVDAGEIRDQYDDPNLPVGAVPGVENGNGEAKWETETSVDLFKNTYTDADGKITVESVNGDKIIAPGTSNDYSFTIKNTGNISLDYTLKIEGSFKISDKQLPFYVRLRIGDEWIVGGEEEWIHLDSLGDIATSRTLPRDKSDTYTFEWKWPYDADEESDKLIGEFNDALLSADANDTQLGDFALALDTDFSLNITTSAVVTPGTLPIFGDGTFVWTELVFVCVMAGLILACMIFLILFFLNRKVYLVTFVHPSLRAFTRLDKKAAEINGKHTIYPKVRFGTHTFGVSDNTCTFKLKRGKIESGVTFGFEEDVTVVTVDRSIRALELHFTRHFHGETNATLETGDWAAIDKKRNVYTPTGVIPADPETKTNSTPNGLSVDEHGKYSIQ